MSTSNVGMGLPMLQLGQICGSVSEKGAARCLTIELRVLNSVIVAGSSFDVLS